MNIERLQQRLLGDPRLGEPKSTQIRYEIVEKALQTLTEPVDKQTVFNWQ